MQNVEEMRYVKLSAAVYRPGRPIAPRCRSGCFAAPGNHQAAKAECEERQRARFGDCGCIDQDDRRGEIEVRSGSLAFGVEDIEIVIFADDQTEGCGVSVERNRIRFRSVDATQIDCKDAVDEDPDSSSPVNENVSPPV